MNYFEIECFKCEDTIEDEEIYGGLCRDCAVEKAKKTFTVEIGEAFVQWYNETIAEEGVRVQNSQFPILDVF